MAHKYSSAKKRDREVAARLRNEAKRLAKQEKKLVKTKNIVKSAVVAAMLIVPGIVRAQAGPGGWRMASSGGVASCYSFNSDVVVTQPNGATTNRMVGRIEAVLGYGGPIELLVYDTAASSPAGLMPSYIKMCNSRNDEQDCVLTPPKGSSFTFTKGLLTCANNPTASDPAVYSTGGAADFSILYQ